MERARRIVDLLITDIIGDGDISQLPGAGMPLRLEDDPHTPGDQRLAQKIMRDHAVSPAWISLGNALALNEAGLLEEISERAKGYLAALDKTESGAQRQYLEQRWTRRTKQFRERIDRHNREVMVYNLKVPAGIPHKPILDCAKLIKDALRPAK